MNPTQNERDYLERNKDAAATRKKRKAAKGALEISGKRLRKLHSRIKMEGKGRWKGGRKKGAAA